MAASDGLGVGSLDHQAVSKISTMAVAPVLPEIKSLLLNQPT